MTTGALYFFFKDKEDLFASLVEEPLHGLYELMRAHYVQELQHTDAGVTGKEDFMEDIVAAKQVVHYMYQHYEEFQLLLTKCQGSRFEQCVDQFVDIAERHYRVMADRFSTLLGGRNLEDYMVHWMAHMQVDAFAHMLTHERSEEAALTYMEDMVRYMVSGWMGMFRS